MRHVVGRVGEEAAAHQVGGLVVDDVVVLAGMEEVVAVGVVIAVGRGDVDELRHPRVVELLVRLQQGYLVAAETEVDGHVQGHIRRLPQAPGIAVVGASRRGQQTVGAAETDLGVHVVVAHVADVLDVVTHAVVGQRQAYLEPANRPVVHREGGLHVGRNLRLPGQQHAVQG